MERRETGRNARRSHVRERKMDIAQEEHLFALLTSAGALKTGADICLHLGLWGYETCPYLGQWSHGACPYLGQWSYGACPYLGQWSYDACPYLAS